MCTAQTSFQVMFFFFFLSFLVLWEYPVALLGKLTPGTCLIIGYQITGNFCNSVPFGELPSWNESGTSCHYQVKWSYEHEVTGAHSDSDWGFAKQEPTLENGNYLFWTNYFSQSTPQPWGIMGYHLKLSTYT